MSTVASTAKPQSAPPANDDQGGIEALAWLSVAALALVALVAMLVLAEPIGDLIAPTPLDFFNDRNVALIVRPEHAELVRVEIAILAVLAAAALVAYAPPALLRGRLPAARPVLSAVGGAALIAVAVVAWVTRSEPQAQGFDEPDYFTPIAGIAALAFAALALWLGAGGGRPRIPALARAWAALRSLPVAAVVAVVATICFLLPAVFTESSLADSNPFILHGHLAGIFADFVAVDNGRTPGVDFAGQYSALLPYALWPVLALTDYSAAWFTIIATCLTGAAMLVAWRLLALATRDELAGLALYLPVLAISVVPITVEADEWLSNASQYQILPERYLLPLITAWLLARHLRGLAPRRTEPLLLVAAIAAFNNPEFGLPCLGATVIALALARRGEGSPWGELRPLLARTALAVLAVGAVVCAIALIRTGSLPDPAIALYFPRLFGSQGFGLIPMPDLGFHLAVFATFAGALIVAAVRVRADAPDRAYSALLGFAGALGVLAFVYYGGRSNAYSLNALFPLWGLTLALLTWLVLLRIRSAPPGLAALRRAGALGVCALVGFGLALTSVTQVAAPWEQLSRIADTSTVKNPFDLEQAERFIAARTEPDEPVAIIGSNGFLIARDIGISDVALIDDPLHFIAGTQVQDMIDALDEEGGSSIFFRDKSFPPPPPGVTSYIRDAGFRPVARDPASATTEWQRPGAS